MKRTQLTVSSAVDSRANEVDERNEAVIMATDDTGHVHIPGHDPGLDPVPGDVIDTIDIDVARSAVVVPVVEHRVVIAGAVESTDDTDAVDGIGREAVIVDLEHLGHEHLFPDHDRDPARESVTTVQRRMAEAVIVKTVIRRSSTHLQALKLL